MDLPVFNESEQKFRYLFETMFEGFLLCEVIYDEQHNPFDYIYVEANNAAAEQMGVSREEIIGSTLRTLLPGISEIWLQYYSKAALGENVKLEEYSPILKKYFKAIIYMPFEGFIAVLSIDITRRKQAEQALRLSEERLRYSLEAAGEGYWDWNMKTQDTYFSPRYYKMLGYEPHEFNASFDSWVDLLHPDEREWLPQAAVDAVIQKGFLSLELRMRNKSGEYRWLLTHWKVFERDDNNMPSRIVGTNSDITERKRIEEALFLNEKRISLILDTIPVAFFDVDFSNEPRFEWISRNIDRITGFTAEQFIRDNSFWFDRIHRNDRHLLGDISKLPTGVNQVEYRWKCAGNKYKWFLNSASVIKDKNGCPSKIIGSIQDITKSKLYESKIKSSEKQAHALSIHLENLHEEVRKNIAREVHDELGQSLTVLKLTANSIKKDLLNGKTINPSELDEMIDLISSTIKSVQRITTELRPDILDTVGLIAAIEWQAESFQNYTSTKCELELERCDPCFFDSNVSTVIFRTIQEALTNVTRHAEATKVKIALKKDKANLILSIEDNGIGISPKKLKDISSFGLKGMQERASFIGSKLIIRGDREKGTVITLKIPLKKALINNL